MDELIPLLCRNCKQEIWFAGDIWAWAMNEIDCPHCGKRLYLFIDYLFVDDDGDDIYWLDMELVEE